MCKAYRNAEEDLEKKVTILEASCMKLETQLNFLRRISDQKRLNSELAQCHFMLLQNLQGTLLQAVSQIETAVSSIGSDGNTLKFLKLGKWKYAIFKKTLDRMMAEMEAWQARFDPSWYLIILIGDSVLDPVLVESHKNRNQNPNARTDPLDTMLALRRAIEAEKVKTNTNLDFDANQLTGMERTIVMHYTSIKAVAEASSGKLLIMETIGLNGSTTCDVENLARRLQTIDPDTFGLLRCEGILRKTDPQCRSITRLDVVYRAPLCTQPPTTLRRLLVEQGNVSHNAIVNLAQQLVRSVSYIHACDFVHKNIRPEDIVLFPSPGCPIGSAYLLGFNQLRSVSQQSGHFGDSAWHRNLYRHPQRQGLRIEDTYIMQHEIYSLGVCLLEIGLWRPFVWYRYREADDDGGEVAVTGSAKPMQGRGLELRSKLTDKIFERAYVGDRTALVKKDLVEMARRLLPSRMGMMYTGIVESCLTCLDEGNEDFGTHDSITVGVRFVEKILARVGEIRV
ncbi:eukaryotic translation initiation factor 2-alpha kinase 1 [Achaetomium macrosporum]|uniref:Eukaryotic translation initiation factor 2-alpha kinase 1 n=1 Tax=Achaetomium macrosporum TaxID=79813 RepID=A0AAN7HBH3_9PEZI|nr:eukaryotic translation initiation factor 2-alpha kinase 1 [Achaetomium macrosporum]